MNALPVAILRHFSNRLRVRSFGVWVPSWPMPTAAAARRPVLVSLGGADLLNAIALSGLGDQNRAIKERGGSECLKVILLGFWFVCLRCISWFLRFGPRQD